MSTAHWYRAYNTCDIFPELKTLVFDFDFTTDLVEDIFLYGLDSLQSYTDRFSVKILL